MYRGESISRFICQPAEKCPPSRPWMPFSGQFSAVLMCCLIRSANCFFFTLRSVGKHIFLWGQSQQRRTQIQGWDSRPLWRGLQRGGGSENGMVCRGWHPPGSSNRWLSNQRCCFSCFNKQVKKSPRRHTGGKILNDIIAVCVFAHSPYSKKTPGVSRCFWSEQFSRACMGCIGKIS